MTRGCRIVGALAVACWALLALGGVAVAADDFVPLFAEDGPPKGWLVRSWDDLGRAVEGEGAAWTVRDGVLRSGDQRGTWLVSEREYGDFILEFEVRLSARGNSGVALRTPLRGDPAFEAMELQLADVRYNPEATEAELTGAIYRAAAPAEPMYRPAEWNTVRIVLQGTRMEVVLNGRVIHNLDLDRLDQPTLRHDGTEAPPVRDRPRAGRIGFQHLGRDDGPVLIRNARIRTLGPGAAGKN